MLKHLVGVYRFSNLVGGTIYFTDSLGLHFDTIILCGLLLAFLLNSFFFALRIKTDKTLLATSLIMSISYGITNHLFDLGIYREFLYLSWIAFDIITIIAILAAGKLLNTKLCSAAKYIILGLSINAFLCLVIHIDLRTLDNREPWWFWSFYSLSINIIDLFMIVSLMVNRDFLKLEKLMGK